MVNFLDDPHFIKDQPLMRAELEHDPFGEHKNFETENDIEERENEDLGTEPSGEEDGDSEDDETLWNRYEMYDTQALWTVFITICQCHFPMQ